MAEQKAKKGKKAGQIIDVPAQSEGKELQVSRVVQNITPFKTEHSPDQLIAIALDKNVPVDVMEKLMAMHDKLKKDWAREQYNIAMAEFQAECPVIQKKKKGGETKSGATAYKYAPLDDIIEQVRELIAKHGFSYTFRQKNDGAIVGVTCIVSHISGHSEESTMETGLATRTGVMSGPQQIAATVTFNKRYSFCNAFGIMTGDEDVDAAKDVVEPPQDTPKAPPAAPQKPAAPVQPPAPQFINKTQSVEINGLIKALRIEKTAKQEIERIIEADMKEFKNLTAKEAEMIIAEFKGRLAKVQAAPDVNVVDPSANAPKETPKQTVPLPTRAMSCKTQEEAADIIGEATLSKEISEVQMTALKNILTTKGFKV